MSGFRIAIAGYPRTGKTTLAAKLDNSPGRRSSSGVVHADDLIPLGWSEASEKLAQRMFERGPWVIEGVAVVRALRKALHSGRSFIDGRPCDQLYWLDQPFVELSPGQVSMGKGAATVLREIEPELARRGVHVLRIARAELGGGPVAASPALAAEASSRARVLGKDDPDPLDASLACGEDSRWADFSGRGF